MTRCPLLTRTPIIGTHQAHRCKAGHAIANLTLYAFCSEQYKACPDYGRWLAHQKPQEVKRG